jgi:hypothetical protein
MTVPRFRMGARARDAIVPLPDGRSRLEERSATNHEPVR